MDQVVRVDQVVWSGWTRGQGGPGVLILKTQLVGTEITALCGSLFFNSMISLFSEAPPMRAMLGSQGRLLVGASTV